MNRIRYVLMMAALLPAAAQAQTPRPEDVARGVTVLTRPRPEVDPVGVRIGAFRLDASADLGLGFDSNVFGNNALRRSTGFFNTALRASLVSEWTTHALAFTAGIEDRRHFSEQGLDWTDWNVGVAGRYDFSQNLNVSAGYSHQRLHLPVGSIDVQQAGILRQVPYSVDEFRLGGSWTLNRVRLTAETNYRMFRFDSVGADILTPSVTPGTALLDFNTWAGGIAGAYELAPGRSLLLTGRVQDVRYTNGAFSARDSFTWAVLGGFRYDFDGVWQASAAIGYIQRDFSGAQFKSIQAPIIEAQVFYNLSQITTFSLAIRRSIDESVRSDTVSFLRTLGRLGVDHELRRDIILSGAISIDRRDYEQPRQRATDAILQVGAQWFLNRSVSLGASYQYTNRLDRSGGIVEFDQHLALVRVRFAL